VKVSKLEKNFEKVLISGANQSPGHFRLSPGDARWPLFSFDGLNTYFPRDNSYTNILLLDSCVGVYRVTLVKAINWIHF